MRSSTVLFAASAVLSAMPAAVVAAASSGSGRSAVASSPQGASSSDSEADPSPGPTGFPFWIIGPIIFGSMVLGFTGYLLFHVCKDACDDLDPPNIAADLSASTAQPQAPPRRRRRRRNPGTDTLSTSESGSAGPGSNGSSTSSIFIPERQSKRRAKAKDRESPQDGESMTPATTQNPDPNNRHSSDSGYMSTGTSRSSTQDSRGSNDERYYADDEQRRARRAEQSSSGSRSAASSHGSAGSRHSSQGGRGENSIMRSSPMRQMTIEMSVVVAPRPEVNTSRSTGGDGSDTPRVFFTSPTEGLHGGAVPPANTNGVTPPPAAAPEPSPLAQSLPLVSNGGSFASSVDCPQPQSPSQKPLSASGFGRSSTTSYPVAQSPAQSSAQPPTAVALAPMSRVEFAQPTQPSAAVSQQTMLWQPTPEMLTQPVQYPHHQGGRMCSPGTAPTVPSLNNYHGSVVGGVPQLHLSQSASTSAVLRYSPNVSVTSGPSVPPGPISTTQARDTRVESTNSRYTTPDSAPAAASPPPLGGSMTRSPAAASVAPALAPKRSPPGAAGNNSGSGSGAGFGNNSSSGGGAGADASPRGFSLSVTSSNGQVLPRHAASASAAPVGPSSNDIHSPLSPSAPHSPPPPLPPGSGPFGASSLRTQSESGCLPLPNVIKFPGMSPQSAPQDSQQQHHLASFGGSVPSAHQLPRSFESEQRGGSPYQSPNNNNIANQESHMKQSSTDGPHQHHHSGDAPPSSSILSASTTAAAPSQLQSPDTRPQRQRMVVIRPEGLLELESSVKDRDAPPRHAGPHRTSGATSTTLGASSHSSSRAHDDMGSTASLRGSQRELPIPDFQASTTHTHTHSHHSNTNNTATTPASGFSSTSGRPPSALSPATFSASGGSYLRGGSSMHQPDADDESTTQTAGASGHRMPFGGSVASDAHVLPPPAVALVSAAANAHNDNEHHERHEKRNERNERSRRQQASSPDHSAAPQPGGHSRPHSFFAQSPASPALGMSTVNDRAASSVHSASTRTFGMSASGVERHDEHTLTMSTATLATPTNHLHGTEERQSTASGERSSDHGSR